MARQLNLAVLTACLLALLSGPAWTQENPDVPGSDGADVRIIVDISGSMKDNDPDNLRQPAVRLLARMIPDGSGAGVWTFGQYVNMLVPYGAVDDAWRDRAIDRSTAINSVALRTNLGEAIEVASDDYFTRGDLTNTDFILLTDGKVDISDNADENRTERERILGPVLDRLTGKGATVHTVALSEAADAEFLKTLADETGGSYQVAASAEALNLAFLEALNAAVPQDQIPIEGDGFSVDAGVREFTALIFWGDNETRETRELELVDPQGQAATLAEPGEDIRWARETGYDLMTVREPAAGKWQIKGELGEGSRVTVVSDLRMVASPIPASFSEDEPLALEIAFYEEGSQLTDPDFLGVLEVRVDVTSEDNRRGSKVLSEGQPPEDGIYRDSISALPEGGRYAIDVIADGKTFSRKFSGFSRYELPEGPPPIGDTASAPEAEPEATAESVPEPEPASEPPVEPEPGPETADALPDDGPIDTSAAEEPAAQEPATPSDQGGFPLWWIAAAIGGILLLILVAVFVLYRRKKDRADSSGADEAETPSDDEEAAVVPVVEPEPEPEPVVAPEADEPTQQPESTEGAEEPAVAEAPEVVLPEDQAADEADGVDRENDPEIPVAEPEAGEEEIPVADEPVDEDIEDIEDFGLEDFDLSEFDDLSDIGDDDKPLIDDEDTDESTPRK